MLEERESPLLVVGLEVALKVGEEDGSGRHLDVPLGHLVILSVRRQMAPGDLLLRHAVLGRHGRRHKADVERLAKRTVLLTILVRRRAEGLVRLAEEAREL